VLFEQPAGATYNNATRRNRDTLTSSRPRSAPIDRIKAARGNMARVTLIDDETNPELAELIDKLRAGRRGTLINVYRLLLHSPALAGAWFSLSNTVRWKTELDGRLRELVIIRVASTLGADYIVNQHVPELTTPEGLSEAEVAELSKWRMATCFSEPERAALAYADTMTRDIVVPDEVHHELKRHFNERQIVELTVLIGSYNMNARVLTALEIDPQIKPDAVPNSES
jgi:alkylhydroperoxidase family enzyme